MVLFLSFWNPLIYIKSPWCVVNDTHFCQSLTHKPTEFPLVPWLWFWFIDWIPMNIRFTIPLCLRALPPAPPLFHIDTHRSLFVGGKISMLCRGYIVVLWLVILGHQPPHCCHSPTCVPSASSHRILHRKKRRECRTWWCGWYVECIRLYVMHSIYIVPPSMCLAGGGLILILSARMCERKVEKFDSEHTMPSISELKVNPTSPGGCVNWDLDCFWCNLFRKIYEKLWSG